MRSVTHCENSSEHYTVSHKCVAFTQFFCHLKIEVPYNHIYKCRSILTNETTNTIPC